MFFLEILTITFVALKLGGAIDWSWWWVFAPMWVAVTLWLVIAAAFFKAFSWMDRL